jgi:hypothetical protein
LASRPEFDVTVFDLGKDETDCSETILLSCLHGGDLGGFYGVSNHIWFRIFDENCR